MEKIIYFVDEMFVGFLGNPIEKKYMLNFVHQAKFSAHFLVLLTFISGKPNPDFYQDLKHQEAIDFIKKTTYEKKDFSSFPKYFLDHLQTRLKDDLFVYKDILVDRRGFSCPSSRGEVKENFQNSVKKLHVDECNAVKAMQFNLNLENQTNTVFWALL